MTAPVVCLGDVMIDIVATLPGPLATGSDTPAPIHLLGGGSAANTACWLATTGQAVSLIGAVGADPLGSLAVAELTAAGVRTHLAVRGRTGSCIVLVDAVGERTMIPDAGANTELAAADVDPVLFGPGRHLHLSAYSLFHAAHGAARHALDLARRTGMSISVDAASAAPLAEFGPDRFAAAVGPDVLLLANLDEATVLSGTSEPRAATTALAARFGRAVVKLGADGALWADASGVIAAAAHPLQMIDSTGAGDAFAAGLLGALVNRAAPSEALSAANALAAKACGARGGRPLSA